MSEFLKGKKAKNLEFMKEDLDLSALTADDIKGEVHEMLGLPREVEKGYLIPYHTIDGERVLTQDGHLAMWRTKLYRAPGVRGSKYTQPSGDQLARNNLPPINIYFPPYLKRFLNGPNDVVVIAEGEKKAASVLKWLRLPAMGIGGCYMWVDGTDNRNLHPQIVEAMNKLQSTRVLIIPDGDIDRYDIRKAYGDLAHACVNAGYEVEILGLPNGGDKIDDMIKAGLRDLEGLDRMEPGDLVQSRASLARQYGLATEVSANGNMTVQQHTANVKLLLEKHPAFPEIYYNRDANKVVIGDGELSNATCTTFQCHLQMYMQMNKVSSGHVYDAVMQLASENQRSPFYEKLQALEWDGEKRLDTWLSRLWGVEDNDYHREVSAKWLIGAVARLKQPGCKLDWMLVTTGGQGIGKTSMPAVLFPGGNSAIMYGDNTDKDFVMRLASTICTVVDEMGSFSKRDVAHWKAVLSNPVDEFRPPYGRTVERKKRAGILYGTSNLLQFLTADPSGHRRYAPVHVERMLDFKGLEEERWQLWAEAVWRLEYEDDKWWELEHAASVVGDFVADDLKDIMVGEFTEAWCKDGSVHYKDGTWRCTTKDVLTYMGKDGEIQNAALTREISQYMRVHGWVKSRSGGKKHWRRG